MHLNTLDGLITVALYLQSFYEYLDIYFFNFEKFKHGFLLILMKFPRIYNEI